MNTIMTLPRGVHAQKLVTTEFSQGTTQEGGQRRGPECVLSGK